MGGKDGHLLRVIYFLVEEKCACVYMWNGPWVSFCTVGPSNARENRLQFLIFDVKKRLQPLTSLFFAHPLTSKMFLKTSDCISHRPLHSFSDIWGVQKLSAIFRRSAITSSERHSSEGSVAKLCTELCHLCSNASANNFLVEYLNRLVTNLDIKNTVSDTERFIYFEREEDLYSAYMSGYEVPVL